MNSSTNNTNNTNNISSVNIGNLRFLINGRYVVKKQLNVKSKTGESILLSPKTILTVNRFENSTPILRWMNFEANKFMEINVDHILSEYFDNFV